MSCSQCAASCPAEQRENYARACWLATGEDRPVPECEWFKERYWRGGEYRTLRRKGVKQERQRGVRHGRSRV
jgi:uncharacterized protein with PIN domain